MFNLGFFLEWSLTTFVASGNNKCKCHGTDQVVLVKCKKLDRRRVLLHFDRGVGREHLSREREHDVCTSFARSSCDSGSLRCRRILTSVRTGFQFSIISMSPTRGPPRTCINGLPYNETYANWASQFRTHPYKVCVVQEFAL